MIRGLSFVVLIPVSPEASAMLVKAELSCPENTELRCTLFTDPRAP
jgi:hypothetical protein